MEEGLVALESGTSVNIKRTDGRIHSAVVSGVNWETRSVTVEWFERGETKGKEIEMEAILNLNADLLTTNQDEPAINNNKKVTRATRANNPTMSVASSKAPYRSTRNQSRPTNIVPAVNGHGDTGIPVPNHRVSETVAPTPTHPSAPRHTMQMSAAPLAPAPSGAPTGTGRSTKGGGGGTGLIESAIQNQNQNVGPAGGVGVGAAAAAAGANNAANNRRSNVVKEVERLKKNREERRQRQAELKEEKEALMNLDPGNPNWEFLAMIREYRNGIDIRPLRGSEGVEDHQITVCVRKRPLNKKELTRKEVDVITVPSRDQLVVHEPKNKVDLTKYLENAFFRFDYAFDEHCGNEIVYKYTAQPLVQTIFEGGMATCFAYGQTGSGKTHTMGGDFQGKTQDCKKGIYAMAAKDVFKYLKSPKYQPLNLVISASFFEIYSGKVFDLLADKAKLRVLEDGKQQVQIVGLTEQVVGSVEDVLKLIQHGNAARTSGQTSANSNSSRSHAVFQIVARTPGTHRVHGKFSLIDLAGNERGADTSSANRQTRMEGAEINKSLLSLKECIRALGRKNAHLPFRASKLTQVLRDSFIGEKSRTCMIAMISPGLSSCEHSLNTLRYADRVKELAANGPSENKASPEQDRGSPNAVDIGLDDSDLAQLRSLNEGEISADLYTFHEAVSQLQLQEDEVLDTHKSVLEASQRWHEMDCRLLADTRDVDYDQDGRQFPLSTVAQRTRPTHLSSSSTKSQNLPEMRKLALRANPVTRAKSQTRIPPSYVQSGRAVRSQSQSRISDPVKAPFKQQPHYSLGRSATCTIRSPWVSSSTTNPSPSGTIPLKSSSANQRNASQGRIENSHFRPGVQYGPKNSKVQGTYQLASPGQRGGSIQRSKSQAVLASSSAQHLSSGRTPLSPLATNGRVSSIVAKYNDSGNARSRSSSPVVRSGHIAPVKRASVPQAAPLRKCVSQVGLHRTARPLQIPHSPQNSPPLKRAKSQMGLSLIDGSGDGIPVSLKMLDDDTSLPSWYHRRQVKAPDRSDSTPSLTPSDDSMSIPFEKKAPPPPPGPVHQSPLRRSSTENGIQLFRPLKRSFPPERLRFLQDGNPQGGDSHEDSTGNLRSHKMHGKSQMSVSDTAEPTLQGAISTRFKEFALSILLNTTVYLILPFLYSLLVLYIT